MNEDDELRRRDPEATQNAILSAAAELFVERGFAAASMSEVAKRAGVTKSLIHHHFGSKEELWQEVKRRKMEQWVRVQQRILGQEGGDMVPRSVQSYFRFLQQHPEIVRLNSWMTLEDPKLSEAAYPELIEMGARRLAEEQRKGAVRSDVDPRNILAMFIALNLHWFTSRNLYRGARLAAGDNADEAYLEDMLKVFVDGLRPQGPK